MKSAKPRSHNLWSVAPSWSWASVPLKSEITDQHRYEPIGNFELIGPANLGRRDQSDEPLEVVKRGALVKFVSVRGLVRRLLHQNSTRTDGKTIDGKSGRKDEYNCANYIDQFIHSRNFKTGQLIAYEPHKKWVVCQLDYLFSKTGTEESYTISDADLKTSYCLQIDKSSLLLLRKDVVAEQTGVDHKQDDSSSKPVSTYRRVGVCNSIQFNS